MHGRQSMDMVGLEGDAHRKIHVLMYASLSREVPNSNITKPPGPCQDGPATEVWTWGTLSHNHNHHKSIPLSMQSGLTGAHAHTYIHKHTPTQPLKSQRNTDRQLAKPFSRHVPSNAVLPAPFTAFDKKKARNIENSFGARAVSMLAMPPARRDSIQVRSSTTYPLIGLNEPYSTNNSRTRGAKQISKEKRE